EPAASACSRALLETYNQETTGGRRGNLIWVLGKAAPAASSQAVAEMTANVVPGLMDESSSPILRIDLATALGQSAGKMSETLALQTANTLIEALLLPSSSRIRSSMVRILGIFSLNAPPEASTLTARYMLQAFQDETN